MRAFAFTLLLFAHASPLWAQSTVSTAPTPPAPAAAAGTPNSALGNADATDAPSRLTRDSSEALADRRTLLLTTGEDKTVDLTFEVNSGAGGITVGNPGVVATVPVKVGDQQQLILKPLKSGSTTVVLRDGEGAIRLILIAKVSDSNLMRLSAELRNLLRDIEGLELKIVGQKIVIDGEVLVPNDYARVLAVTQDAAYKAYVLNLTTLSQVALRFLAKKIQTDIAPFAPNVRARVVNGMVFLEGTVDNPDDGKRAYEVATLYIPEALPPNPLIAATDMARSVGPRRFVQNFIIVNPPAPKKQEKLVRVTMHFVELTKGYNRNFGFDWQPGFQSNADTLTLGTTPQGGVATSGASFTAIISNLFPRLKSAQDAGFARVLKTGTLMVRSGQTAKLNEVTQFPFTVQDVNGQPVGTSVDVGLQMQIVPTIVGQTDDVQLNVRLSQSSVAGAVTGSSAPVRANSEVETSVYVKANESAAIAGVTGDSVNTDFNRDPASGSFGGGGGAGAGGVANPTTTPLFNLRRTKAYRKNKSQFVIFVTPSIIENASEGSEDLKRGLRIKVN